MSWITLAVVVALCLFVGARAPGGPPTIAQRQAHIDGSIRCPSCQDLSVAQSSAPIAQAVRDDVHARLVAGQSDDQILTYIESRYGTSILLSPPTSGISLVLWVVPAAGFAVALVALAVFFRRRARPQTPASSPAMLHRPASLRRLFSGRRTAVLVAGVACLLAGASALVVIIVSGSSGTRLPGQGVSGSAHLSPEQQTVQSLQQAQILEEQGKFTDALKVYDSVLKTDPTQSEALAYRGWIMHLAGQRAGSDATLFQDARNDEEQSIAASPGYADPKFFLGAILFVDYRDVAGAMTQMQSFLSAGPSPTFLQAAKPLVGQVYAAAGQSLPAGVGP